ncbi:MAG: peptidoglycan editing factor PgeF [Bacteroidales bacterium]|nr:peptidoglycan editing factor PgeF [Bacteroidales bacterium]
MNSTALEYFLGEGVEAFSTRRECTLPYDVICAHQVHDNNVACVENPELTREDLEGFDALITSNPECAIAVRTADCIPILLYDPVKRVVAAVHSGWKGTVKRITAKCIFRMRMQYKCNPEDIRAVIGPGISVDSFQVGNEVVDTFKAADFDISKIYRWDGPKGDEPMKGGHHLDLFKANRMILEEAGLRSENIQVSGIDTYTDDSFFSARREGTKCGRIINVIRLK